MTHDDPILRRAFESIEELAKEMEKLQIFVDQYRKLKNGLAVESANVAGTNVAPPTAPHNPVDNSAEGERREAEAADAAPARRTRVTNNPKPAFVVAEAVKLIREMGRPMTRRQIHAALKDRGIEVRGADPVKALGTMLWRSGSDHLVQIENYGYWLKGEPHGPSGYQPTQDGGGGFRLRPGLKNLIG